MRRIQRFQKAFHFNADDSDAEMDADALQIMHHLSVGQENGQRSRKSTRSSVNCPLANGQMYQNGK